MRRITALCICLALAACSSNPVPAQHLYLLSAPSVNLSDSQAFQIGIESVSVAPYLRRSELMLQVTDQEMRPARYHRWAEPLAEGISHYLRDALSQELGTAVDTDSQYRNSWNQRITISIHRLHGELDGSVHMDATYAIRSQQKLIRKRFNASADQSGPGYPALVDAHQALLSQLANEIRQNL